MKRTIEKSIVNNIVYVEPNYVNSIEGYNENGLNTYEFAPSLEDYCLYVNLEVETRGRNIQSSKTSNGKKLVLSFVSHTDGKSSINFMQGSKIPLGDGKTSINSLTTNYTDIFLSDLKNKYLVRLDLSNEEIEEKIKARAEAKANKDYAKADEIRNELESKGIVLLDSKDGTTWNIKELS